MHLVHYGAIIAARWEVRGVSLFGCIEKCLLGIVCMMFCLIHPILI